MASAHPYTWTRADGTRGKGWRAYWTGVDARQHSRRGFDRKADALAYATDREAEARHGITLDGQRPSGKTTVEQWVTAWLAAREVKPGTLATYRDALKRVEASFGGRTLASLRKSEIRAWRRGLEPRLAPTTAANTAAIFGMLLKDAVEDGLLPASPMPPAARSTRSERLVDPEQLLTPEQVRAWDDALPVHCRGMALVAATTGARQGELLGMRAGALDMLRRRWRIEGQLQRRALTTTKTPAGVRTVPLPLDAVEAIAGHMAAYPSDGDLVWLTSRGLPWSRTSFQRVWTAARDRAGLPEWAHWHALRDVAASAMIRQGVDLMTITAILGHSSTAELKTYARLWPDAQERATEALDRAWRNQA